MSPPQSRLSMPEWLMSTLMWVPTLLGGAVWVPSLRSMTALGDEASGAEYWTEQLDHG